VTARVDVITSDGVVRNLDQLVQSGVQGVTGLMRVPEKRGGNLVIPGSHGELHIPSKKYGAGSVVLPLWVRGFNTDGSLPGPSDDATRTAFHQNLRAVVGMFTRGELITIRHTLLDGSQRQIEGEVIDAIEPTVDNTGRYTSSLFSVAVNCHLPFWSDLTTVTAAATTAGPSTLTQFAGADAPMEDLVLTFGPQSNPRLTQTSTGLYVGIQRVISAGQTVVVDTTNWQVFGTGGTAPGLFEDLIYGGRGSRRWWALQPEPGGTTPIVGLTQTGGGTGSVSITGLRRYKIA
jgi:hypothetical protein